MLGYSAQSNLQKYFIFISKNTFARSMLEDFRTFENSLGIFKPQKSLTIFDAFIINYSI